MSEFISSSPEETEGLGRKLAHAIERENKKFFIAMYGDLGAGKTVFVRGLSSVLSPTSRVKSPTFTIVNEYRRGKIPLFHFDLYRIKDESELDGFGFEEYLEGGNCIAEWSENLHENLPEGAIKVKIEKLDEKRRRISVEAGANIEKYLEEGEGA